MPYTSEFLNPLKQDKRQFFYSGQLLVPDRGGDYEIIVEAQYVIFDEKKGAQTTLEPYRKTTKGPILHVRN